jgi:hypothetical protein
LLVMFQEHERFTSPRSGNDEQLTRQS